ncbi:glycoside hydrolase family 20 zincin-like fold domain-containing protein [Alloiococcus sp. CFN-8]|uniref:glycoside hydrolase family 20 zincin-like fold domain-containing protein n=1 Tax=Alloiococcus sp. CFN-8 TaxID=3416081 RepID=UPI003CF78D8F
MYILPRPQKVDLKEGKLYLPYNSRIIIPEGNNELLHPAKRLQATLREELGQDFKIEKVSSSKGNVTLLVDAAIKEEGYILEIDKEGVRITGHDYVGVLYGTETLKQIILQKGAVLPYLKIEDYPEFKARGYYHDTSRGRIPTLSYLKALADKLCCYKVNQLQLYIEHTYMFSGLSEMWRDETPLTAEEILELDSYCMALGIDLVPSLSTFGHLYKLLNTKSYGHLSEMVEPQERPFLFMDAMRHHTIDASNPESLELIKSLIVEYMSLFSSSYFNICCDETFDMGKGRGKALAEDIGGKEMYIRYVNELCEFIIEKGKIPMFWGDIISGFPEMINRFPKETICLNWGYAPEQREHETEVLAKAGAVQYLCPGVAGWNRWINLVKDSYLNITRMCGYARKHGAIGILNTDWGDYGHINHPDFSLMGLIYGASFSWNSEPIDFEEINKEISRIEFGDNSQGFVDIVAEMAPLSVFQWVIAAEYREKILRGESEEDRLSLLDNFSIEEAEKANETLISLEKKLQDSIKNLTLKKRREARAYEMAAHGMRIFNSMGSLIYSYNHGEFKDGEKAWKLASELEEWFMAYKEEWRRVSKEAALYKVQGIIHWYADSLRTMALELNK